ncbi:MAG: nucleoside-binding protein [Planctomycetes bacterium]|nr:nucleoside-binding protein [Planctomycetota bacterium]
MIVFTNRSLAFDWSITELHYQYGILDTPTFAGGGNAATHILTLQHASGWKYGDNFIFIDFLEDSEKDDFNDTDLYGEAYFNFSLSKIFKTKVGKGPVKDIGALAGINMGADSHVLKYLPGIRLSWDVPGFTFLNTDFTAYIDDSSGIDSGGAPKESDSFYIDINWAYPLRFGSHIFSIEGHMEYIGERTNEFGDKVSEWFFAQPQFRYDLGNTFFEKPNTLFIGIEWQTWINKLGDSKTDENTAQFLMVRRF